MARFRLVICILAGVLFAILPWVSVAQDRESFPAFRISATGPDGHPGYDATFPAIASGASGDRFFVVWQAQVDTGPLTGGEYEVFGQFIGHDGALIGDRLQLSQMGPDGDPDYDAEHPAVAFDPDRSQFLVVWSGDDSILPMVEGEAEIFGRLVGASGQPVGAQFRISDMGPDGDPQYDAEWPDVIYNPDLAEFFVVWSGDDDTDTLVESEYEVHGRRVDATTGSTVGQDRRISNAGAMSDPTYGAGDPALAYSSTHREYLVVWSGDDETSPLVRGEYEIFGQRLNSEGLQIGINDFRISSMGGDGDYLFDAYRPDVVYNDGADEYFVVWEGDIGPIEEEIFGQRLRGVDGSEVGDDDLRISFAGGTGDASYTARSPRVELDPEDSIYLVVWSGDDSRFGMRPDEHEIFLQRLAAPGAEALGPGGWRVSHMGPDFDPRFWAWGPAVAVGDSAAFVVWTGEDDTPPLVEGEFEIWASPIAKSAIFGDGFDVGNCGGWSYCGVEP